METELRDLPAAWGNHEEMLYVKERLRSLSSQAAGVSKVSRLNPVIKAVGMNKWLKIFPGILAAMGGFIEAGELIFSVPGQSSATA